jgi:ribonuclease HI
MKLYCDGGARGNPGPAAAAFVVRDDKEKILFKGSEFLGVATNNVAEYRALIAALDWAGNNASEDVEVILDSELVKKQMTGEYKVKDAALKVLAMRAKKLERLIVGNVRYTHTPRKGNSAADSLVNTTLDERAK